MTPSKIFPADNIAFYTHNDLYSAKPVTELYPNSKHSIDDIEIYIHGPWQLPARNSAVSARYVIGQSVQGYHWRTEFCFNSAYRDAAGGFDIQPEALGYCPVKWSPASASMDDAIKRARRCIVIQTENLDLDTNSKITLRLENGKEESFAIDKIPLELDLLYRVDTYDLHRLALFNGYLSWSEFEHGALDLASFHSKTEP